jgi:acetolactate synthase-1/2/3 large subunit
MAIVNPMLRGDVFLAKTLAGYGITHVFYMESVLRRTLATLKELGVKGVLCHSEKAAAYMADGYARAGRKPGVCMSQSVGAANLASGLQEAWLAKSPIVALTGRKPSSQRYRNAYQEVNHWPLFEPVTKYNIAIENAAELPQAVRQLFREAVTGTPGPVHMDMPNHQASLIENGEIAQAVRIDERFTRVPPFRSAPDPKDVAAALNLIYKAQRPVIVAGGGATAAQAHSEVQRLIETLHIPLAVSVDGKGILPDTHPLHIGVMGGYGRSCTNALMAEADLVLFIGCSVCDQTTKNWTLPGPGAIIIQIDNNGAELGRNYPNDVSLFGDAALSAACLADAAKGPHLSTWADKAAQALEVWRENLRAVRREPAQPVKVEHLCRTLEEVLPDDGVVVADTGFASIWAACQIELTKPGQRFIRAGGGSLGWGFPASLGVKCALPDKPVICFIGDGGVWYHLAEMETAVRCNIPSVTVVNNNQALGMCRQQITTDKDMSADSAWMYEFGATRFADLAVSMGAMGLYVDRQKDIADAVREALAGNRPALVEVMTDVASDPQRY